MMMTDETKWGPRIERPTYGWPEGKCPIPWARAGEYQIVIRGPFADGGLDATDWYWGHLGDATITAYRIRADLMSRLSQPAAPPVVDAAADWVCALLAEKAEATETGDKNGWLYKWEVESISAVIRSLHARAVRAEAERDHHKAKTAATIGFTHEPTGRRITVYAADKATLDALLYTPGIVEALREIHHAPKSAWIDGPPRSGVPAENVSNVVARLKGNKDGDTP